jgi:hypothetical protein
MGFDHDPEHLLCPSCGREHPLSERFCAACGMPLVHPPGAADASDAVEPGELREQTRKIKPQYSEGRLVKVAYAQNQPEAELIRGLLLEEGIPCLLRNPIAGYAPVAGSRDILVPESGVEAAREALTAPGSGGEGESVVGEDPADGLKGED